MRSLRPIAPAMFEAFVVGAILSGAPSTTHALLTHGDPLAATRAAGAMFADPNGSSLVLFGCAAAVHLVVSALWTVVLGAWLPARHVYAWAALAALGIAVLDLGCIGRFFPSIAALAIGPQVADHLAFTLLVAWVLRRRGALTR